MTTLFSAIFYLWLVLTILLAAMWFLREQDRRRKDQQQNQLEDELLTGPGTSGQNQEPAAQTAEPEQAPEAVAPEAPSEPVESVTPAETPDDDPQATSDPISTTSSADETIDETTDEEPAEVAPLPWSKNTNKRKKKGNQRSRSKPKSKGKTAAEEPQAEEPATEEPATEEPAIEEPQAKEPATEEPMADASSDEDRAPQTQPAEEPSETIEPVITTPGIVDLLDGVTLPFDLTPLTARIEDPNRHAIFISPNPDAAEVGTAFADELVQQGFEIEAAGFDQALASRGSDTLSMRISPEAGTVADGSELRYPSASPTDVAIEVWIGNGSPPPLVS